MVKSFTLIYWEFNGYNVCRIGNRFLNLLIMMRLKALDEFKKTAAQPMLMQKILVGIALYIKVTIKNYRL